MIRAAARVLGIEPANDAPSGPDPRDAMRAVEQAERDELLDMFDARSAAEARAEDLARQFIDELETEARCQDRICKLVQDRSGKAIDATPNPITPAEMIRRVTERMQKDKTP